MSRLQQQAIVIGDSFNNTLGLIRSLGEAKVDIVLLLVGDDRLFVSKSRYLKKSQIFQMETIDDCLPTLLRIADKTKQQTIICTNDIATQYIDEYESENGEIIISDEAINSPLKKQMQLLKDMQEEETGKLEGLKESFKNGLNTFK